MPVLFCLLRPVRLCRGSEGQVYRTRYVDEEAGAQEAHRLTTEEEFCG